MKTFVLTVLGVALSGCALLPRTPAGALRDELLDVGRSKTFIWAWTEEWTSWGGTGGVPRFHTKVGDRTGRAPRMMYYDLALVSGTRADDAYFTAQRRALTTAVRTHWRACRGIPVFSWHLDHPCCTNGFKQTPYRYKCAEHKNVVRDILTGAKYPCATDTMAKKNARAPYASPRDWYFARLADVANFLNGLVDDEGRRIPAIVRYEHECDGDWFWWGDTWCTAAEYVAFSRMTADYLREKCGRENLLFAYTPDCYGWKEIGSEETPRTFLTWYPGDDYVDVIGFDDYSIGKGKTPEEAEKKFNETLRRLRLLTAFAQERGKVLGITETGLFQSNLDFWTRFRNLATAEGVDCAFANTWDGPWTTPETEEGWAELQKFVSDPAVLTVPDAVLQKADLK